MSNERQGMTDVRPGLYVTRGEGPGGRDLWRVVVVLHVTNDVVTYREGLDPDSDGQVHVTQWIGSMKTGTIRAVAMSNDTERDSSYADADVEGVLFRAAAEAAAAQDMRELHHVAEAVVMWRRDGLSPEFCSRLAYLAKNRMAPGHVTDTAPACITVRRTEPFEELIDEHVTMARALELWEEAGHNAILIDERDGLMACMQGINLGCECPRCSPKVCECEGCSRIVEVPQFPGEDTPETCRECCKGTPNDPAWDLDDEPGPALALEGGR